MYQDDDTEGVKVDPTRAERHVDHPADVGVLSVPRTAARGRYYYQDEWSAFTRRRVQKHLDAFDDQTQFVEFAIEAARSRRLPPPNARGERDDAYLWSVDRIVRALRSLLRGNTAGSHTLQFFNATCDELDGLQWTSARTMPEEAVAVIAEHEDETLAETASDEAVTEVMREIPATIGPMDLRHRYVTMLIAKAEEYEGIPPDDLLDRIERNL